jgi:CheY-like chemotaxis protein
MTGQIRVLLADDHPVVREGLTTILNSEKDIQIIAEATDGEEACKLYEQLSPDVLMLDLRMPKKDGLQVVTELMSRRVSKPRAIVMTAYESEQDIRQALSAGAKGFLVKGSPPKLIREAVRRVAEQRIFELIESGVKEGATLLLDGRNAKVPGYEEGNFIGPTIFTDVTTNMKVYRTEIFGPVQIVLAVPTLDDAIALVNRNPFGNGVGLFTQSGAAARKFQSDIDVGQVGINIPIPVPVPFFSFTGSRGSKLGDLGPYGKQVVQFYTQTKTVTARWFNDATANNGVNTTISLR